ncbi:hypothetical protein [Nocardia sp. CA-120079]|uniref:hypothetical protein n=1 Tax=Nocardia sp. CA-120079 TaxID=3239974 RepID=UPI003D975F98
MTQDDPLRTHHEVATTIMAQLAAAGFEDAVEIDRGGFGMAHIAGGFQTAAGIVTESPAFTVPDVLDGNAPTAAAVDVHRLGATLFCTLTGHAAFQRGRGENMVTPFLRITAQPMPDLRDSGIPDDVSVVWRLR